jgi:hypothetical protein
MSHVVTAPLVIAKKADGSDLYLYEGAVIPDIVPAETVKRLADIGLVRELSKAEAASVPPPPISESN